VKPENQFGDNPFEPAAPDVGDGENIGFA